MDIVQASICGEHHRDVEVEEPWELNLSKNRPYFYSNVVGNGREYRLLVFTAKAMENSRWDLSLKQRREQLRTELTVEETRWT